MTSVDDLTRFEKARIIGIRSAQISNDAPVMIPVPPDMTDPIRIAELEFEAAKTPMVITIIYPNGEKEDKHIQDLEPTKIVEMDEYGIITVKEVQRDEY